MNTKEQITKQVIYLCDMQNISIANKEDCIMEMLDNLEIEIRESIKQPKTVTTLYKKVPMTVTKNKSDNLKGKHPNNSAKKRMKWIHARKNILQKKHKKLSYKKLFAMAMKEWNQK